MARLPRRQERSRLERAHYDFNWQLGYNKLIAVPAGTKLHVDAHFDNSSGNKANPNPNKTVYYGEMSRIETESGGEQRDITVRVLGAGK